MGSERSIGTFAVSVLQDTRSWIVFPKRVDFQVSIDGKNFTAGPNVVNNIPIENQDSQTQVLSVTPFVPTKARYVKVILQQYGKLPAWHPGSGGDSFIFIDEIELK
jgi:hypothetical protein